MQDFAKAPFLAQVRSIHCSAERKAIDGAVILSAVLGVPHRVLAALGENDRSATGYLPQAEFEMVADAFFARPEASVRGWERAVDAQARIVSAVDQVIGSAPGEGNVAIVSHGGVGALYLAQVKQQPISRAFDQPGRSGGNYFVVERGSLRLLQDWRSIDP